MRFATSLLVTMTLAGCLEGTAVRAEERAAEPVVGGPCERCEAVFIGLPETLEAEARIESAGAGGEPMRLEGTVRDSAGRPAAGVIVYAYHTDQGGIYPRDPAMRGGPAYRHGRLRGWAESDAGGRYAFDTLRPGGYPDSGVPAHVHMHVIEVGRCTYFIDNVNFTDDPRLGPVSGRRSGRRGGDGLVEPRRDDAGTWRITRDIVLGEAVPGYSACGD